MTSWIDRDEKSLVRHTGAFAALPRGVPSIYERTTYQPSKDTPTRPGAMDAFALPSRWTAGQASYPRHHK